VNGLRSIVTPDGITRSLGLVPSKLFGAGALPDVPIDQGAVLSQAELVPFDSWPAPLPIMDQGRYNACTWYSSCQALQFARYENGQKYIPLDCLTAYLKVTGGRNVGTNILQAAELIAISGIPPVGAEAWDIAEEAMRFRLELSVQVVTWPQILTCIVRRRAVVGSVCVGPEYMTLDAEGVMGVSRGQANHAVMFGGGLKWSETHGWCIKHAGSWGPAWGQAGFGWYCEEHFDRSMYGEAYVVATAREDLAIDVPPPVPTA
jgi:hypothetical protein